MWQSHFVYQSHFGFNWVEFVGVLRHMQRYFSHICDGTDVQADWRRNCIYGRAPNAIDISYGSLTCMSYTDTGPPFLYGDSDTTPHLVAFYDTLGIRRTYSRLKPPASSRGPITVWRHKYIYTYKLFIFLPSVYREIIIIMEKQWHDSQKVQFGSISYFIML